MVEPTEALREMLNARSARPPQRLILGEGGGVATSGGNATRERDRILDGERGSLRQERQHRVRRIADERDLTLAPVSQSGQPIERPAAPAVRSLQQ